MNRQEFLRQLENLLMNIPENERMDALAYYNDYFDEAGIENEQRVIQELGSPEDTAQSIIDDVRNSGYEEPRGYEAPVWDDTQGTYQEQNTYQMVEKKSRFKTWQWILIIILLVITFPVWIGLVAGLFGGLVGLIGGLFGTLIGMIGAGIGLLVGGAALFGVGLLAVITNPVEGFASMGVGALLVAIGILLALLFVLLTFVWLPKLIKVIIGWVKGLFHRNEGGDEI